MLQKQLTQSKRLNILLTTLLILVSALFFFARIKTVETEQQLSDVRTELDIITLGYQSTIDDLEKELQLKGAEVDELTDTVSGLKAELSRVDTIVDETGLSREIALSLYNGSLNHGIELAIVLALAQTESSFQPSLVSSNTNGTIDVGILQINSCHADMWQDLYGEPYSVTNVTNTDKNIKLGLKILSGHLDNNGGDMTAALTAYNRGQGGMEKLRRNTGSADSSYSRLIHQRAEYWRSILL